MKQTTEISKKKTLAKLPKSAKASLSAHNHSNELVRLSRIKGQVEGIERMIKDHRYCPEIVIQIKAVRSALRNLEANVIEGHMRHCVKEAMTSKNPKIVQEKLEEIVLLMKGQG